MVDEILKLIRAGVQHKDFFDYDGVSIPVRPITSMEMDDARYNTYELISPKMAELIVSIKLGRIKPDVKIKIQPGMFKNIDRFDSELEYWITYHGMKDFRDKEFSIDDVRLMKHVHGMAKFILKMSAAPKDSIREIVTTKDGVQLANIVYKFNVPLADAAWKLTPLQHDFLILAHPDAPKKVANSLDDLEKIMPAIGKMMKHGR